MNIKTPYYLIHEDKLLKNLKLIRKIRRSSGAKFVLALKCFSAWSLFSLMRKYLDGTTGSSLYEARLGHEKFGKEVQVYSVAFSKPEIKTICRYADKIIFNSIEQLKKFSKDTAGLKAGLRINPQISYSHFDLADPSRKYSRLGVTDKKSVLAVTTMLSGLMFHFNCENGNFRNFSGNLKAIAENYGYLLHKMEWVSLGGGIYFTKNGYPVDKFSELLKKFSNKFSIQVYLEPGEAAITQSAELVTKVLDIVHNKVDIAIIDSSIEAHMLDLLVYRTKAKIKSPVKGKFKYMVAGRSCLAGDIFGTYRFKSKLKIGSVIKIADAAGYTIVKKNWFNGLSMPSIVVKKQSGKLKIIRQFKYNDFLNSLS